MKKEYTAPQTDVRMMHMSSLLVTISGGEAGTDGDTAQGKDASYNWDDSWEE